LVFEKWREAHSHQLKNLGIVLSLAGECATSALCSLYPQKRRPPVQLFAAFRVAQIELRAIDPFPIARLIGDGFDLLNFLLKRLLENEVRLLQVRFLVRLVDGGAQTFS
jgi:hypothetical protein